MRGFNPSSTESVIRWWLPSKFLLNIHCSGTIILYHLKNVPDLSLFRVQQSRKKVMHSCLFVCKICKNEFMDLAEIWWTDHLRMKDRCQGSANYIVLITWLVLLAKHDFLTLCQDGQPGQEIKSNDQGKAGNKKALPLKVVTSHFW